MPVYATPETVVRDPRRLLQEICTIQGIFDYTEYRVVQSPTTGGMGIGVFLKGQLIGFGEGGRFYTAKRAAARKAIVWLEKAAEAAHPDALMRALVRVVLAAKRVTEQSGDVLNVRRLLRRKRVAEGVVAVIDVRIRRADTPRRHARKVRAAQKPWVPLAEVGRVQKGS